MQDLYICEEARRYFLGLEDRKLKIQRCKKCNKYNFFPRVVCPDDMGELEFIDSKGMGKILSFTIVEKTGNPKLANKTPFVMAVIELVEGPTLLSRVIGINPYEVTFGQEVELVFNEENQPFFKPF
jgi:uncharacterized protein